MAEASGALRRRGSLSARPRSEVPTLSAEIRVPAENDSDKDGIPCPRQVKPLLHFYKYLQPLPDGRKLQLQLPPTVVCDKKDLREETLALRTDANGFVVRDEKGPAWRKRLLSDFMDEDPQNAASLLSVGMDDVVAVRNVAHWKGLGGSGPGTGGGGSGVNIKSLVLTRRALDLVVSAPCDLGFSVQKYVRCRGSHASIFRVTWGDRENRRFAINISNEKKTTEASTIVSTGKTPTMADSSRPQGTPSDAALRQMAQLSPYYLVTGTSGSDPKRQQQHAKLPRIRGNPVVEGLHAVRRIIEHFTAQLPGIRVRELTADFIKDGLGQWWFIRVTHFDACYRIDVPLSVQNNSAIDSAAFIHDALRSKYFRQTLRTIAATPPGNCMVPQCSLCGCSCELPRTMRDELRTIALSESDDLFRVFSDYRMTLKMVVSTLFQLRQRGESLLLWEHAALLLMKNPTCHASEFTVCYLCYRIYKSQLALSRIAQELNEAYGVVRPSLLSHLAALDESGGNAASNDTKPRLSDRMTTLCSDIHRVYSESCVSAIQDDRSSSRAQVAPTLYTPIRGQDVDPTCMQLRLVFFFHELQDGGPAIAAEDFYLEYHLGQHFSRLDFDGSKRHTPNRWQLCEARVHYLLATMDDFGDYCNDKRIQIRMKTVAGSEYHGHTSISLRPLLSAAKWFTPSVQHECRVDYLLELKTDTFGVLTLKVTLGLLLDSVPLALVRDLFKDEDFLREGQLAVFWPPPWFQSCSLPVPVDWIGALMPSEYISILPRQKRQHLADRLRIGQRRRSADTITMGKLEHDMKSPSVRFALANRECDGAKHEQFQAIPSALDPLNIYADAAGTSAAAALRILGSVCVVAKRVIYRVAGEVPTFPTVLIGHILRHTRYLSPTQQYGGVASWVEPALFHLTQRDTIDSLTRDIDVDSIAALSVVGEIFLILARCQLAPLCVGVANLERTIGPYWLLSLVGGGQNSLSFDPVSLQESHVSARQRMVWNRAIRRCQVAHFCGEFRPHTRAVRHPDEQDATRSTRPALAPKLKCEEMQTLQRRVSYRLKMQSHVLCEVVEIMEADSGMMDIAELRSFHKCLSAAPRALAVLPTNELLFHKREHLNAEELEALSNRLAVTQEATEALFVERLMNSDQMVEALSQFDRLAAGTMNFDEFWELGDTVLNELSATYISEQEEPRCTLFCLRHGTTDAFTLDRCCVLCSVQYQDQEFLPRSYAVGEMPVTPSSGSDSDAFPNDETHGDGTASPSQGVDSQGALEANGRRSISWPGLGNADADDESLDEDILATTLEQLRAAEWHVRYSRNSLGRAALEALLSENRSSFVAPGRRPSAMSMTSERFIRRAESASSFPVASFVAEAEERKQHAFCSMQSEIGPPQITRTRKKKNTGKSKQKKSKSTPLLATRLQNSNSLSTLLRMELDNPCMQGIRSGDAIRSTRLIKTVHRGETKRNKLDRLVLEELNDVKQRLARLLASS